MSKIFMALGFVMASSLSFADGKIVYLDQVQLQKNSMVLTTMQQKITIQYESKLASLQTQQEKLNNKLSKAGDDSKEAVKLSNELLQLQEQVNNLQSSQDTAVKQLLSQYFAVERTVLKQMLETQHYDYILNVNSIYMAESVNDVTPTVIKLTDSAYEQKYSH